FHFLEINDGENWLIKKRTEKDVWFNLYNFPLIELKKEDSIKDQFNLKSFSSEPIPISEEIHILSHQKLHIHFWRLEVNPSEMEQLKKEFHAEIIRLENLKELPFPRPIEKYLYQELGI